MALFRAEIVVAETPEFTTPPPVITPAYLAECGRIAQRQRRRVFLAKKNCRVQPVITRQARRESHPRVRRAASGGRARAPSRLDDEPPEPPLAPRVLVELALEGSPRVLVETGGDSEAVRLVDWLLAHDELFDLVSLAVKVQTEWERRESGGAA